MDELYTKNEIIRKAVNGLINAAGATREGFRLHNQNFLTILPIFNNIQKGTGQD